MKKFNKYWNKKVKKLNWVDIKLTGLYGMILGVLLAKCIPSITNIRQTQTKA